MKSDEQFNNIESKIIEAANGSEYVFTDAAWEKMESLLDKKKRRRIIFFWMWPLALSAFLLGTYFLFLQKPTTIQRNNTTTTAKQNKPKLNTGSTDTKTTTIPITLKSNKYIKDTKPNETVIENNINDKNVDGDASAKNTTDLKKSTSSITKQRINKPQINTPYSNTLNEETAPSFTEKKYKTSSKTKAIISKALITNDDEGNKNIEVVKMTDTSNSDTIVEPSTKATAAKTIIKTNDYQKIKVKDTVEKIVVQNIATKQKKESNKKTMQSFYVVAITGVEANTTDLFSFTNTIVTPVLGLDIGFKLNDRWSLQTGFHTSAKKYIGGAKDYTPKAGSYLSTVKIIKVDANCRVYEIPLSVQYYWRQKKSLRFFSTAGISGYIMKSEDYDFDIETNNGFTSRALKFTGNKHLFASVHISTGIEKQFGKKFYLQASPVVYIPLDGIGQGGVKLYTKSMLLGFKYFPFRK